MERQESKSDQIGRRLADVIYPVSWLLPTGLTLVTIEKMFEDRPLGEKAFTVAVAGFSWVVGLVIRQRIEKQWAEDSAFYFDEQGNLRRK